MNKSIVSLTLFLSITSLSFAQFGNIKLPSSVESIAKGNGASGLSDTDIVNGLKEALTKGAQTASQTLNKTDGYNGDALVRIPFPQELAHVEKTLREIGLGKQVDEFIVLLNRSAEQAAVEAAPIFVNAVKEMSFQDAKSILTGPDTAATGYLRKATYSSLFSAFSPHIKSAMDKNAVAAKWTPLADAYNKLPTTRTKVNPDLVAFTTNKALKGLFVKVADEEMNIRNNAAARTSDILKKVFGSQGK